MVRKGEISVPFSEHNHTNELKLVDNYDATAVWRFNNRYIHRYLTLKVLSVQCEPVSTRCTWVFEAARQLASACHSARAVERRCL